MLNVKFISTFAAMLPIETILNLDDGRMRDKNQGIGVDNISLFAPDARGRIIMEDYFSGSLISLNMASMSSLERSATAVSTTSRVRCGAKR